MNTPKITEALARKLCFDADYDPDEDWPEPDPRSPDGMAKAWTFYKDKAAEFITIYVAALEAEGFVIAPMRYTEAMSDAAQAVELGIGGSPPHWARIYRAMLDARPKEA